MDNADVDSLWVRLRRRKVVQWGVAYGAGAWGLLQGLAYATATFHWPAMLQPLATLGLLIGLPIVLVIAWYHGDRGQQRVTAAELAIITLLFLVGGAMFWRYDRESNLGAAMAPAATPPTAAATTAATTASTAAEHPQDAPDNSIAVLPFVNMSGDPASDYFSDGISEEILNVLASTPELQVAARTSSFAFKGQQKEVPLIARELRVRMVLEGSVRRQDQKVRITAQLIDAKTGFHLWSETYDRELKDIFAIQDEIARAIGEKMKVQLGGAGQGGVRAPARRASRLTTITCVESRSGNAGAKPSSSRRSRSSRPRSPPTRRTRPHTADLRSLTESSPTTQPGSVTRMQMPGRPTPPRWRWRSIHRCRNHTPHWAASRDTRDVGRPRELCYSVRSHCGRRLRPRINGWARRRWPQAIRWRASCRWNAQPPSIRDLSSSPRTLPTH